MQTIVEMADMGMNTLDTAPIYGLGLSEEIVPFCLEHGIAIQTYSVLKKGLLTGRYQRGTTVEKGNIREESPWFLSEKIVPA